MNINQIRQQIKAYGAMIDAPPQMLTVFDQPQGDGTPFVVVDEGGYRYIFEERGMIFEERKTKDERRGTITLLDNGNYYIQYGL